MVLLQSDTVMRSVMNQQRMLLAVVVLMTGAAAHPSAAQNPETPPPRRGGLLPQRTAAPSVEPISRAELLRRFDLNADGSIDEAEAEIRQAAKDQEWELAVWDIANGIRSSNGAVVTAFLFTMS